MPYIDRIYIGAVIVMALFLAFAALAAVLRDYGNRGRLLDMHKAGAVVSSRQGWFIMEFPAVVFFIAIMVWQAQNISSYAILFSLLWLFHYGHRAFVYPLKLTDGVNTPMPLLVAVQGGIWNMVNATANGLYIWHIQGWMGAGGIGWELAVSIGVFVFTTGQFINIYHDYKLIRFKKQSNGNYTLPDSGLWKYVIAPNYFGEILIWAGFCLALQSLPALLFFCMTLVNLVPRAVAYRGWYQREFSRDLSKVKAVIPFIL